MLLHTLEIKLKKKVMDGFIKILFICVSAQDIQYGITFILYIR